MGNINWPAKVEEQYVVIEVTFLGYCLYYLLHFPIDEFDGFAIPDLVVLPSLAFQFPVLVDYFFWRVFQWKLPEIAFF